MEVQKHDNQILQWHPAFFAGIQIELERETDNLIFESEHQLGTKPKEIDVLIIKKECDIPIQKNIGKIFRKHNIIEYKGPNDYMSIDDFYKVYGYACFYKADEGTTNSIKIEEITISLVCHTYPYKLMRHMTEDRKYRVDNVDDGIYYINGDKIPIQIILTKELSEKNNLWLKSLTNNLIEPAQVERLIKEYEKKKENKLYESVMDIIVRANKEKFQEVKTMCEALEELMKDELEAKMEEGKELGEKLGKELGKELALLNLICKKLKKGKSPTIIAQELEEEHEVIVNICQCADELAPDYNCDLLYEKLHGKLLLLH